MKLRMTGVIVFALAIVFAQSLMVNAQQKRFYIGADDHTDYFWIADGDTYRQAFLTMSDYYLDKMDETQNNPSDFQMRWSADGSYWMWEYERNRTSAQFGRFLNRVRDGHMSVPLNPLVLVNGGAPAEAVLRGMYYPGLIERRHNVKFPMAIAMENQTQPFGLSSLWAGSGAKYSWKGVCNCASQVEDLENRDREIYYAGGRDGSKLLMKWHSQYSMPGVIFNQGFGGYSEAYNPLVSIQFAETNSVFQTRYPFDVIGAFGRGYDDLQYTSDEFVTIAQNNTNPNRRIIVSDMEDFFEDFETNHGDNLETYSASFGNEWDVLVASMAEVSAKVKRSLEKLRTAEAMATLVSRNNPTFMDSRITERDKATIDFGMYFEHDWTADGAISRNVRANWTRSVENEISGYVNKLETDAKNELSTQISRTGDEMRFFVFNPLSWVRTDYADIPFRATRKVHVVDVSTGQEIPSQIMRFGNKKVLRILAESVPSVGYKVFEIRNGSGTTFSDAATVTSGNVIENNFYKITVANDGAITSLIDKTRSNRELVRTINDRVINDLGGNRSGRIFVENSGEVSITLRAISISPLQHTTRITLFRNSSRIDIENQVSQNFGDIKTWAYSFDINSPDIWHEEVGAVIRAKLLADGGHYSPRNARYDWLTMNHFADISDGSANNFGATISNRDAYFMQVGDSSVTSLDTISPQISVLFGGQIDGPQLGIPNQGGDSFFTQKFALRTHGAFNQTDAMKFSLEHQNPFTTKMISGSGTQNRPYPADNFSLVQINEPDVLLWAIKPAEDGINRGIIARVWNQSNSPANYDLSLFGGILEADETTHIETFIDTANVGGGVLHAPINQQQIQTHLLKP